MPINEAPCVELGSAPETSSVAASPSPSEISSASSPEPHNVRATPLFRALAMPPPDPVQPPGQDELERRLPGYRRIVIPRELTLIELLKQSSGVITDEEVLCIREAKLRVVAERVGLRRLHVLVPRLRSLTLDGSAISSLRDLGIGLVHLKILSVNRCGLSSLDGVWGLGSLRELYATGNSLHDFQPLAGLQKLHTLNLADNPITESSRLWTLGICNSLRYLTLRGTPVSELAEYRSRVASILPMLVYLDDRPLHTDVEYDDAEGMFDARSSSSDSDESEMETKMTLPDLNSLPPAEPVPGPSKTSYQIFKTCADTTNQGPKDDGDDPESRLVTILRRKRPATTEGVGFRPLRPNIPTRPRTAQDRYVVASSGLRIMNTLLDDEWRCSGSRLTSHEAVCGNLAQALRRPFSSQSQSRSSDVMKEMIDESMADASRAIAAEIPLAPCLEDWEKFRKETGIDIEINFNQRPKCDPSRAIERLEQIEKETSERLKDEKTIVKEDHVQDDNSTPGTACLEFFGFDDSDSWRDTEEYPTSELQMDVDGLFDEINPLYNNRPE